MSNLWDNVRKHTRRWSAGPAKLQIGGVLDENASHPIKMQLGDEVLCYEHHQWYQGKSQC
ncbi:hypothetical protein BATDEDRAFT_89746 [Batrachochytrium dendrobatidis JAM81]|uniref:Uncharacterized protein n=1 Tax=Batrachochytrium dendrobatidis (strain JAM81 / FGSC 10211) TaxID=684364 RepID=F4P5W9_BATDJ|nr:uncharacterized protein BATDEDRAFT_89746 [Batrachochytrium dendrobatidis JAM81]EGF79500.1 hypothetical protein BATDEDRAFT_89746 [Batrachochytrium dendrobatidis JAM81]|eukprot:XP_006680180.1 hypothetical protein BATDEDRAFT_89746 [Batrachochytrium dendrobatidis JAM81]